MLLIFVVITIYIVWTLTHEHHTQCEYRDCENCPFPKCKGSDNNVVE